ncbi:MAG: hypothetical protein K0Q77_1675 [Anaerosporomusa subterranea]|nr:hypothetical protein [Anaerosporomusa subterranea]
MKPQLNVLHLASFEGNVGDNANHIGTRSKLGVNLDFEVQYTNLEIREFYWKKRSFDNDFVSLANKHDLVIIGGGNYFELWVPNSFTGTSLDISNTILNKITTPILFYSLGCDVGQGVSNDNLQKFRQFLDHILGSSKYLVSVRNDGSLGTIDKYLGKEYAERIDCVPDGGFFTIVKDFLHPELPNEKNLKTIAINLAGDMLDVRFNNSEINSSDILYEEFLQLFGNFLNNLFMDREDARVVFIPHIFRDLDIISDVLKQVEDIHRRKHIAVAPYLHGSGAQEYIFDLYRKCDLVLGTRFHANVCPIGLNTPTIGLVNYPQIQLLYEELGMPQRTIQVNKREFDVKLSSFVNYSLENLECIRHDYSEIQKKLDENLLSFHMKINHWLNT